MPVAVLALAFGYRSHRQPVALELGALAAAIAYLHILAGTPEWTMYFVLAASVVAAGADWRASRVRLVPLAR